MKFRTMLLASAAVMFTSSAFAADITNPFFLPTQGKFLSDTKVQFSREKMEGTSEGTGREIYAREQLAFGLTDNLAVFGAIGNTFDYGENNDMNNDHNFDYELGVKYNHNFGKVLTQVGVSYWTYDPQSWYGQDEMDDETSERWRKGVNAHVMLGYAMATETTTNRDILGSSVPTRNGKKLLLTAASVMNSVMNMMVTAMITTKICMFSWLPITSSKTTSPLVYTATTTCCRKTKMLSMTTPLV